MFFSVPSPVVEVTSIDTVEYDKATTLECNAVAVRGITSRVDIFWVIISNYNYTIVRSVDNVTANIVGNSAVYSDQLVTPPLNANDNGRVYYCAVNINATFGVSSYGVFVLDFTGMYVSISVKLYILFLYIYVCLHMRMYYNSTYVLL